ncbi:MAG TPA: glycosyltransferase family 2 protein [Candidatus Saccharimonadales bacterium]|nr:glycosyltransferase family 2 protein [Candidatus Saccharimonadales bacterium]
MQNLEIPYPKDRGKRYRFFEILPGALSWGILALPFLLSIIDARITIIFILAYMMLWFAKALGLNTRAIQGYRTLQQHQKLPWQQLFDDLKTLKMSQYNQSIPSWHSENIDRLINSPTPIKAADIIHAVIIATYNETREILEPTFKAVLDSDFDMEKVILVLAYEQRGGPAVAAQAKQLIKDYEKHFRHAFAVEHPQDIPGEVIGKGGNITYAGRELKKYLAKEQIEPFNVVVTTLDADNRPHPKYLAAAAYLYSVVIDPLTVSLQPIPMFTNNIWDAPAPMRVIATGNSFWMVVQGLRTHTLRNFSAHAQNMQTLIDTDFWSVRTIVEDGHQYWRTYFRYGRHNVFPIFLPIYQDAVLSNNLRRTLVAQFIQLRRWAWGASDIAYVAEMGFFRKSKASRWDSFMKFCRLVEGHVSWATAPLILLFAAWIPLLFNSKDFAANQLPIIARNVQTLALVGIFVTMLFSLKTLPPKPARYTKRRNLFMLLQWVYLPVTTIVYSSFSALTSQTRLMFGRYLGKFDVTDKAVITEDKRTII